MIKKRLIGQFSHPRGLAGRLAGRIMATRSSNVERNRWVAEILRPSPDARILEIGHGPGLAIAELWTVIEPGSGTIDGVDVSSLMSRDAARRNRTGVASGRVRFRVGDAQRLPAELSGYDLIYGVNASMFWDDQAATIADLAERLVPGGQLVLAYMPPPTSDLPAEAMAGQLEVLFDQAGLTAVCHDTMAFDPPATATKGVAAPDSACPAPGSAAPDTTAPTSGAGE